MCRTVAWLVRIPHRHSRMDDDVRRQIAEFGAGIGSEASPVRRARRRPTELQHAVADIDRPDGFGIATATPLRIKAVAARAVASGGVGRCGCDDRQTCHHGESQESH